MTHIVFMNCVNVVYYELYLFHFYQINYLNIICTELFILEYFYTIASKE
jgi:hypothetical protein